MVTVKIDRKTGKCEIVDDAEEMPGSSRQITRFRQYCLPILEDLVKKDKILKKQCQVRIDIYFPTDYNYGE